VHQTQLEGTTALPLPPRGLPRVAAGGWLGCGSSRDSPREAVLPRRKRKTKNILSIHHTSLKTRRTHIPFLIRLLTSSSSYLGAARPNLLLYLSCP